MHVAQWWKRLCQLHEAEYVERRSCRERWTEAGVMLTNKHSLCVKAWSALERSANVLQLFMFSMIERYMLIHRIMSSPFLGRSWCVFSIFRWRNKLLTKFLPHKAAMLARYRGSKFCPSVCLSVCHMRALWQNEITYYLCFETTWKGNHTSFLTPSEFGGRHPLPHKICA